MTVSALVIVSVAIFSLFRLGISSLEAWITVLSAMLIIGGVAAVSLPTCYEVQSDRLIIRSGLLRWTIRLDEIVSVTPTSNPLSGPAWSLDRLAVKLRRAGKDRTLLISPKQQDEFLHDLRVKAKEIGNPIP